MQWQNEMAGKAKAQESEREREASKNRFSQSLAAHTCWLHPCTRIRSRGGERDAKYNCSAQGKSIYCIHIWRPCRKGTERGGAKEEARARRTSKRQAKAKTDPTLSLLRQLWCAVDVFVVGSPCNSFSSQSSFGSVTLMILNYCLMIYEKAREELRVQRGRQFLQVLRGRKKNQFRIEHDTKVAVAWETSPVQIAAGSTSQTVHFALKQSFHANSFFRKSKLFLSSSTEQNSFLRQAKKWNLNEQFKTHTSLQPNTIHKTEQRAF